MTWRGRRSSRLAAGALVIFAGLSVIWPVRAAAQKAAVALGDSASPGAQVELTIPALQERLAELTAAEASPDEATAEAIRDYTAALQSLEEAAGWRQRAEALAKLQADGPELLAAAVEELEEWSESVPTTVGPEMRRAELEALLAETEAYLSVLRKSLLEVDAEKARLAERRQILPAELAAAEATRDGLLADIVLPPPPAQAMGGRVLARRIAELAEKKATTEKVAALELELAAQELRRNLLVARRNLYRRKVDAFAMRAEEVQSALGARRALDAETAAADALATQASLAEVHPLLGTLAEENARLASERTGKDGLNARIDATSRHLSAVSEKLQTLEERSSGVRQKVNAAGLSDAIGLLLRKEVSDLPTADRARAEIRARRAQISAAQFRALSLEDELKALPALKEQVDAVLAAQTEPVGVAERRRIEAAAKRVLDTRRASLDGLVHDYNSWFASLVELETKEVQLVRLIEEYRSFLEQYVLWVPNAALPTSAKLSDWYHGIQWLGDPANLLTTARRILAAARSAPLRTGAGLVLLLVAVAYRGRLKRLHEKVCRTRTVAGDSPLPASTSAFLLALALSFPGPFALWLLGWMINVAPLGLDDFSRSAEVVLSGVAAPLFACEFLRRSTGPQGLASAFLEWPGAALAEMRRQVVVVETIALPVFALSGLFEIQPTVAWSETIGRALFCLGVAVSGLSLHRLLRPDGTVVDQVLRRTDLEWVGPLLSRAAWVPSVAAVALILVALAGYYYTSAVLVGRLWMSVLVLLAFVVANAAVLRWLAAREEASRRRRLRAEREGSDAEAQEIDEFETADAVELVSTQTRRLLRVLSGLGLFVALFSVWGDIFPAFRFFEKIELWQVTDLVERTVGPPDNPRIETVPTQVPVTVANLLLSMLGAGLAVIGARNIPGLLELVLLSRLRLDRGLRYAIATVTRYAVFVVGAVVALSNLGVGWSKVQWLVAAVSVGLGFGLQEIFGNFVSGLIILFERPVRVGDTVTIDGVTGTVSRIEMRATRILDFDRKELVVPNKDLITGKLLNWSLQDAIVRVTVSVGVAYGSDTALVEKILLEVAKQCPHVLEDPAPVAAFMKFGDSALDFELRVFLSSADQLVVARHQLLMAINQKFRSAGIEIPFPQRDVHVRTVVAPAAPVPTEES